MKAKAVQVTKIKRKNWYSILAPKEQNNVLLGETFVAEPESAVGRIIHANLKIITDNLRDQNAYVTFKINAFADKNLQTEVTGFYLTPPSIRKITRRSTSRIDESFVVVTKDRRKIRIKPIAVTIKKTVRSIESALRETMRNAVAREAMETTFIEFIQKIIVHQLQNTVKKRLTKVYPLRAFDIKQVESARAGKAVKAKEEKEEQKKEKETDIQANDEQQKKVKKKKKSVSEEMVEDLTRNTETENTEESTEAANVQAPEPEGTENFGEDENEEENQL